METVNETPAREELIRQLTEEYFAVMAEWEAHTPSAGRPMWPWPEVCARILREHTHTDPGTGVTKSDYITREVT